MDEAEDTDLAPDADEPGDTPPEDLLKSVTAPEDVVPDNVDDPALKRDDRCVDEAETTP